MARMQKRHPQFTKAQLKEAVDAALINQQGSFAVGNVSGRLRKSRIPKAIAPKGNSLSNPTPNKNHQLRAIAANYINPWHGGLRLPANMGLGPATGQYRSFHSMEITTPSSPADPGDDGAFCVAVRPSMGTSSTTAPVDSALPGYAYGIYDLRSGTSFPNNQTFADVTNWKTPENGAVDTNVKIFASPNEAVYVISDVANPTAATISLPYGSDDITFTSNIDPSMVSYAPGTGKFKFVEPGVYAVCFDIQGTNLSIPIISYSTGTFIHEDVTTTSTRTTYFQIFETTESNVTLDYVLTTATTITNATFSAIGLGSLYSSNDGPMSSLRPVTMAVWLEVTLPEAYYGGNVAAALLPTGTFETQALTNSDASLCRYTNLAQYPDAYRGKLMTGAYVWYSPDSNEQWNFYPPEDQPWVEYPTVLISGVLSSAAATPVVTDVTIGNLYVVVNYEFTTINTAWTTGRPDVHFHDMVAVIEDLQSLPHAIANDSHLDTFKKFLDGIADTGRLVGAGIRGVIDMASEESQKILSNPLVQSLGMASMF